MSLSDRRQFLFFSMAAAVAGCGFAPVYGPSGAASSLQGRVALKDASRDTEFFLNQRLEERLGRAASPAYRLNVDIRTQLEDLGTTSDGKTTRFHLVGQASYNLITLETEQAALSGRADAFTGYSATGSTVATLAAERDAEERLMRILADQIVDRLVLQAQSLPT